MDCFEVIFFDKEDGTEPAREFLQSIDKKMRTKLLVAIDMLADNGPLLREPYSKHIDDGIFELRAKVGSDISRVLYFFVVGRKVVLTNGFVKKSQRTPPAEIRRAKQYRADFLSREDDDRD